MKIQFQVGSEWLDASPRPQADVKAIRVERFQGGMLATLDRPRTVQLAPAVWKDGFQTQATCQTVQIHLLEKAGQAQMVDAAAVEYTLTAAASRKGRKD